MNELFTDLEPIPQFLPIDFNRVMQAMNEAEEMVMVDYGEGLELVPKFKLAPKLANNKELRLALELLDMAVPLYKRANTETKADFIRDIFNFEVTTEKLSKVKSFKKILYKTVIVSVTEHNGKYIVKHKQVRRK